MAAGVVHEESPAQTPPRIARYPRHTAAVGGALAATLLGLLGLLVAAFTPIPAVGLLLGAFGFFFGLWGMLSHRRALAVTGLVLCCLAVFLGGLRGLLQLYTRLHGPSRFQPTVEELLTPEERDQLQGG